MRSIARAVAVALAAASPLAAGERFQSSACARPASVRPGGIAELALKLEVEPGWHLYSPRSAANGLALELRPPAGFEPFGRVRVPPGAWMEDPVFGRVEALEGAFEVVQRFRVADGVEPGTIRCGGSLHAIACNAVSCLPPQTVPIAADFRVASEGAAGPIPPELEGGLELAPAERARLDERGFVLRARPEDERVVPGEGFFLLVELAVAEDARLVLGRERKSGLSERNGFQRYGAGLTVSGAAQVAAPAIGRLADAALADDLGGAEIVHGQPLRAWIPLIAAEKDPWAEEGADQFGIELLLEGALTRGAEPAAPVSERFPVGLPIERDASGAAPR